MTFLIFSGFCLIWILFIILRMIEPKGKSLEEIENKFAERKSWI